MGYFSRLAVELLEINRDREQEIDRTPDQWTKNKKLAIKFNEEEARDTIEFITNVISEYLGENLYIEEI